MRKLNWTIKSICHENTEGSFATRNQRSRMLALCATQIYECGFTQVDGVRALKPKHIDALLSLWREHQLSDDTIANRLAGLRWLAKKINKPSLLHPDNAFYGLSPKKAYTEIDKSFDLPDDVLAKVKDAHVAMSLRLQAEFGLRREESIKLIPALADQTAHDIPHLWLKPSWTKGGRGRLVPITVDSQYEALAAAYVLVGRGQQSAMIAKGRNFIQQRNRYDYECKRVGLRGGHGLRHRYAQRRYKELSGYDAPILGGQAPDQVHKETLAVLTENMGHSRIEVVASYVGRLVAEKNRLAQSLGV